MDFENITLYPEFIVDAVIYVLVAVLLGAAAKIIFDWKEKRRLAKEFAEYMQKKEDER